MEATPGLSTVHLQPHSPWASKSWCFVIAGWLVLSGFTAQKGQESRNVSDSQDQKESRGEAPKTRIPRESCVTSDCHAGVKSAPFLHGPVNVNACDGCHDLVDVKKHEYRLVREQQGLCAHCHDPRLVKGRDRHEPFAQGDCLACHNPHGGQSRALLAQRDYAETCLSCHAKSIKDKLFGHGPATAGSCGACHEPHASEKARLLSKTGRELCLSCHVSISIELDTKPLVHPPALEDCEVCHDPHATDNVAHLKDDPLTLCTSCHKDIQHQVDLSKTEHGALTTRQSCTGCHDPHASTRSHLLEKQTAELCRGCHEKEVDLPDGTRLRNIWDELEGAKSIHDPVAKGQCAACHRIHGGTNERLLPAGTSTKIYTSADEKNYEICFDCHDRNLVNLEKTQATTSFRNGDQNLHFVHVHRAKKGRSCRICHSSHGAPNPLLLRDGFRYGPKGWKLSIGWNRKDAGGTCASGCHASFGYNREKAILNPKIKEGGPDWKGERLPVDKGRPKEQQKGSQKADRKQSSAGGSNKKPSSKGRKRR